MSVLIEVTIFDPNAEGEVKQRLVRVYNGDYHWEVRQSFERLGELVAKIVDPDYEG